MVNFNPFFDHAARIEAALNNIRIDAATAEVLRAFGRAGIHSILLKGPAIASWYSAEEPNSYLDCDLWVRPRDVQEAGRVLAELGFEPHADERGMPEWWQEHASSWGRCADGVVVDLHRTLQGVGADPVTQVHSTARIHPPLVATGRPQPFDAGGWLRVPAAVAASERATRLACLACSAASRR